jgi:hypothetical protein
MANFRIIMQENGELFETLSDISPESGNMDMLIIAKVTAPTSVAAGNGTREYTCEGEELPTSFPCSYEWVAARRVHQSLACILLMPLGTGD